MPTEMMGAATEIASMTIDLGTPTDALELPVAGVFGLAGPGDDSAARPGVESSRVGVGTVVAPLHALKEQLSAAAVSASAI